MKGRARQLRESPWTEIDSARFIRGNIFGRYLEMGFLLPVYLRESALFWAVDASCAHERGGRAGRGSPSTTSSPGSPSRSRGCCWESLYSFCRLPYHPGLHHQRRHTRPVQCPGWKHEQSGMTASTALHRNDVIRASRDV